MLANLAEALPSNKIRRQVSMKSKGGCGMSMKSAQTTRNTSTSPQMPLDHRQLNKNQITSKNSIASESMIRQSSADSGYGHMWNDRDYRIYHSQMRNNYPYVPVIYPGMTHLGFGMTHNNSFQVKSILDIKKLVYNQTYRVMIQ